MTVTDLNFIEHIRHSFGISPEVTTNEYRQANILRSHGFSASTHVSPLCCTLLRQLPGKKFCLPRSISLHVFRTTDISGKPSRYRSVPSGATRQTLPHGYQRQRVPLNTGRCQRATELAYLCRLRSCVDSILSVIIIYRNKELYIAHNLRRSSLLVDHS